MFAVGCGFRTGTEAEDGPCDTSFPHTIAITPSSGPAGTTISITGTCFEAGERVDIRFHTDTIAQATADLDGSFAASGKVPEGYRAFAGRQFEVVATGKQSIGHDRQPFELT